MPDESGNFPEDEWIAENGDIWTRDDFLAKLRWEGGTVGMVSWGGPGCFPPSLREMAREVERFEFWDA